MRAPSTALLGAATALLTGCTFHSTATHWNGRVGPDGVPVFVKVGTNVGLNVFVVLPLLGNTSIDTMLDEATGEIASTGSDHVRVIETANENYWHGFPPLTWLITPVVTNISVEYRPSPQEVAEAKRADAVFEAGAKARAEGDHEHLIPGPRK